MQKLLNILHKYVETPTCLKHVYMTVHYYTRVLKCQCSVFTVNSPKKSHYREFRDSTCTRVHEYVYTFAFRNCTRIQIYVNSPSETSSVEKCD